MKYVIVTGMSGSGKSTAMKIMEDMGFFCIDNLPVPLVEKLVEFSAHFEAEYQKVAIGIDVRSGIGLGELKSVLEKLKTCDAAFEILFLDADDEVLVKRYKETRRNHPLAGADRIVEGIIRERRELAYLKKNSDYIIDTSQMLTRELKTELEKIFVRHQDYKNLFITILSFGFKYGIPSDSDIVMDVRFLPNPFYIDELRPQNGNDADVRDYVMKFPEALEFLDKLQAMLEFLIPNYIAEGKNQLVVSIGCTGGKHRSVTLANELYERMQEDKGYGIKIEHRDIEKDALRGK